MIEVRLINDGWLFVEPGEVRAIQAIKDVRPDLAQQGARTEIVLVGEGRIGDYIYLSPYSVKYLMDMLNKESVDASS